MKTTPYFDGMAHSYNTTFHNALQHDLLASIRIVENLGLDRVVQEELTFGEDKRFLVILNWIALCLSPEASKTYSGLAVSMHVNQGSVYINLANDDGAPTTARQHELEGIFLSTIRRVFAYNMDIEEAQETLYTMVAQHLFPAFDQTLRSIGLLNEGNAEATYRGLESLVTMWHRNTSYTEANCPRYYNHWTKHHLLDIFALLVFRDHAPHVNKTSPLEERLDLMHLVAKACALILSSTFYLDMTTPSSRPIHRMDPDDSKFALDFIKRVYDTYMYMYGVTRFAKIGLRFIRRSLGPTGLANFLHGKGGIVTNWIEHKTQPSTPLVWRSSPSTAVAEILALPGLDLWDVDEETLQELPHCDTVLKLWRQGAPIDPAPRVHAELVMAHYLEDNGYRIVRGAIGMNRRPCFLCHRYLRRLNYSSKQVYTFPHTDGRTHGPWCIPRPAETQLDPLTYVLKGLRILGEGVNLCAATSMLSDAARLAFASWSPPSSHRLGHVCHTDQIGEATPVHDIMSATIAAMTPTHFAIPLFNDNKHTLLRKSAARFLFIDQDTSLQTT